MWLSRGKAIKGWEFESSSSDAMYECLKYPDGTTSCNCPGWTRRVGADGSRSCKHTKMIDSGIVDRSCKKVTINRDTESPVMVYGDKDARDIVSEMLEKPIIDREVEEEEVFDADLDEELAKDPAERVNQMFCQLRSYGFIAYQGIMHTKGSALSFMDEVAAKRMSEGTPIAGIVWTNRADARVLKSGNRVISLWFDSPEPDTIPRSTVLRWILEVAAKYNIKQKSSPKVDGFIIVEVGE